MTRRALDPGMLLLHAVLIATTLAMVVPFLWMVTTSLKNLTQAYALPPVWIPNPVTWANYPIAILEKGIGRGFWNSTVVTTAVVGGQLVISSLAAYAFARIEFRSRNALFLTFLATMMIPVHMTMIPIYVL